MPQRPSVTKAFKRKAQEMKRLESLIPISTNPSQTAFNKYVAGNITSLKREVALLHVIADYVLPNQINLMTIVNGNTKFGVGKFVMRPIPTPIKDYLEGDGR